MPTHTTPNAKILVGDGKRPVVHVLRWDAATTMLKTAVVLVPEAPADAASEQLYCLIVNGRGEVVVDSVTNEPVILDCQPLVLGIIDQPDRLMSRKEVAAELGVSVSTVKRIEHDGKLAKDKISDRRVGYTVRDVEEMIAKRNRRT